MCGFTLGKEGSCFRTATTITAVVGSIALDQGINAILGSKDFNLCRVVTSSGIIGMYTYRIFNRSLQIEERKINSTNKK